MSFINEELLAENLLLLLKVSRDQSEDVLRLAQLISEGVRSGNMALAEPLLTRVNEVVGLLQMREKNRKELLARVERRVKRL